MSSSRAAGSPSVLVALVALESVCRWRRSPQATSLDKPLPELLHRRLAAWVWWHRLQPRNLALSLVCRPHAVLMRLTDPLALLTEVSVSHGAPRLLIGLPWNGH